MQDLIDEIMDFQVKTFPTSTPISKLHHLAKEIPELIEELEKHYNNFGDIEATEMEFADCFLLLFGAAAMYGLNEDSIKNAIYRKLVINRARKWGKPDEKTGVVLHIKE